MIATYLLLLDRTETLVAVLAHEIRHVWQSQIEEWERRRRGMVWGARGVFSERDADAFAIRKVREYRRHIMQEKEKR